MATITNKTAREKLPERREPYWLPLEKGRAVGFRRMGRDTWVARFRTPDGKQKYHALGDEVDDYPKALKAAEAWFTQMAGSARRTPTRGTVADALDAYVADLKRHGRESTADENEARFKLTVSDAPLASRRLDRVTREDFEAWREGLREGRQNRSTNRQVRSVVAALNYATKKLGHVGNREAWAFTALNDDVEESGEAAVFLTADQRDRLMRKAVPALRAYLQGLEHSGARPSELAVATVADFDKVNGSLTLRHRKGRPARLKARAVGLSPNAIEFFTAQSRGKLPGAPLISNEGKHWRRHEWSIGIRAAITAANEKAKPAARVPEGACAYSFRHARISEMLQNGGIDPITVAQQTGTSFAMIEKFYFKFIPQALKDKLAAMEAA
jgi:integrase